MDQDTIDVIFIIDKSTSMEPAQAALQNNAGTVFDILQSETNGNFRVGIVGYGGLAAETDRVIKFLSFTDNRQDFVDAINLFENRGGQEPAWDALIETTLDAIPRTMTNDGLFIEGLSQPTGSFPRPYGYCPILVTDENSNNNEPQNTYDAVVQTLAARNAPFFGFTEEDEDFDQLAIDAGGQRRDLDDFLSDPATELNAMLSACVAQLRENGFDTPPAGGPTSAPTSPGLIPPTIAPPPTMVPATNVPPTVGPPAVPTVGPPTIGPPSGPTQAPGSSFCPNVPLSCTGIRMASSSGYYKGNSKGKGTRKYVRRGLSYSYHDVQSQAPAYYSKGKETKKGGYPGKGKTKSSNKSKDSTKTKTKKKKTKTQDDPPSGEYVEVPAVPICFFDRYKRIFTTQCIDPTDMYAVSLMNTVYASDFTCGCCDADTEFSGIIPDYCPGAHTADPLVSWTPLSTKSSSQNVVAQSDAPALTGNNMASTPYSKDFVCQGEDYKVCSRPDVFVEGRMYAMCRFDVQTRQHETVCIHHTMREELQQDKSGLYQCGCCSEEDEGMRPPWYCSL